MQRALVLFTFWLTGITTFAGHTEYNIRKNRSELNVSGGSVPLEISYPIYSGYGTPDELRHQGKVRLEYDRENHSDMTWDYDWYYSVVFQYQDGGTQTCTLTVSYQGGNYVYSDYKLFLDNTTSDTREIDVIDIIAGYNDGTWHDDIANPHSDTHIPTDIHLELAILSQRYYELDPDQPINLDYLENTNEIRWFFTQGAESYDLEWVFLDSASWEYQMVMDSIDAGIATYTDTATGFEEVYASSLPFRLKEPTRVNLKGTRYSVDMVYPSGAVFFRVRAVGRYTGADNTVDDYETVKTGEWNYYIVLNDVAHYNHQSLAWHQVDYTEAFANDQNWLYGINFAEDGKSVSTISYYDGSLRGRQSLVYNTSDDITLVGENKYDYEGRQTVQIIPAPVDGRTYAYQDNFNQNTSGTAYEKDDFDKTTPEPLKTNPSGTKGSAQYFSTNNTFTDDPYRDAIPEADGYVYTQVKFNRDATGRVSEVSGIGETFSMGNGHTARYYYANTNDFELRRLFGDEVGYADNYKKTYLVDPNGQASVTYSDNHGRVIATALEGAAPANLVELDDNALMTYISSISTNNAVNTSLEKKSRVTFFNHDTSDYAFSYNIYGVLYGVENPDSSTQVLCAKCAYTLYFHIEDPAGDTLAGSADTVQFSADSMDDCAGTGVTYYHPDNGSVNLGSHTFNETGEYTAVKRLVVNYEALVDSALAAADAMLGGFENFKDSLLANVDISGCFSDCESYCEYKMMQTVNLTGDWSALTQTQKDSAIAVCMGVECNLDELWNGDDEDAYFADSLGEDVILGGELLCEGIKQAMIQQLSPGGLMYQNLDDPASPADEFWTYVDADLGSSLHLYPVYNASCSGSGAEYTDTADLKNPANFQPCWLESLLPYHREYCHYEVCLQLAETVNDSNVNSNAFDYLLPSLGPWPGNPDISDYLNPTLDLDPLNNSSIESAVYTYNSTYWLDMLTAMPDSTCNNTYGLDMDEFVDSIWVCANGSGSLSAQDSLDKWTLFAGLYQDKKNQYINYYKESLDAGSTYIQGCLYYDDDDAIVFNPVVEEDSLADEESFNNTLAALEAANGTILSFNCADQCEQNVAFWMAGFPDTCQQVLAASGGLLYNELDSLFMEYCMQSCDTGNVFGWFYNDESPQYDSIVSFFAANNLQCGLESIQIDTAYLDFDTTVQVNLLSPCLLNLMEFVNDSISFLYTTLLVDTSTDLYNCLGGSPTTFKIKLGDGADSNMVSVTPQGSCGASLMLLYDIYDNPINFDSVNGFGNISASQLYDSVFFVNVYFDTDTVIGKFALHKCYFSEPAYVLNYTPPAIPNPVIDCIDEAYASALFEAEQIYYGMLNDLANALLDSVDCLKDVVEIYKVEREIKEYQYTLYYYDQAGNLTTTVPPLGVHPLTQMQVYAAYSDSTHQWTPGNNPAHELQSLYTYNGANQLTEQTTPDGGTTVYYYDDLFRLRFSQNAQQLLDDKFSYTLYDELGRITEAGEAGDPNIGPLNFTDSLNNYNFPADEYKRDYMKTYYEVGYSLASGFTSLFENNKQENLRNRIGAVEQRMARYEEFLGKVIVTIGTEVTLVTSYSYDFHGNVKELVQYNSDLAEHDQEYKHMRYEYDLISGNVKEVKYQEGEPDEWRHRYHYDANNRLVRAWTSDDGEEWEMDAKYFYYLHGPLARVETGHDKVQGTDFAYNLQGWLKGVNSTTLQANRDLGGDANAGDLDAYSGADAYGFSLGYFDGDYNPIAGSAFANTDALITANGAHGSLYNGNITHLVTAMKDDDEAMLDVLGNIYTYDQLQRIKSSTSYWVSSQAGYISANSFSGAVNYLSGAFSEAYWFDKNGNLDSLIRYDHTATLMDNFTYHYDATQKNRLLYVDDAVVAGVSSTDIDDQSSGNYSYNEIGQLVQDNAENIDTILWTVTGKVRKIVQTDASSTEFIYDAMGNRVMKITEGINEVNAVYTYYVHDAGGNVMATYERTVAIPFGEEDYHDQLMLSERMIYGSKRLGVKKEDRLLSQFDFDPASIDGNGFYQAYSSSTSPTAFPENFEKEKRKVGEKYYEFSEHRGNVLEVTSDRKIPNSGETAYEADIVSYSDYSPYGMLLSHRNGSSDIYRYGFQGQEHDDEIKGTGNSINYMYRMHDPRIGRFFAVDPLAAKYPYMTPYQFSSNSPIAMVELEGLEGEWFDAETVDWIVSLYNPTALGLKISAESAALMFGTDSWAYKFTSRLKDQSTGMAMLKSGYAMTIQYYNNPETFIADIMTAGAYTQSQSTASLIEGVMRGDAEAVADALIMIVAWKTATVKSVKYNPALIEYRPTGAGRTYAYYENRLVGLWDDHPSNFTSIEINLPKELQGLGIGEKIFADAVKGTNKFKATWVENEIYKETTNNGKSVNLTQYEEALERNLTPEEAVWETWTGKQAKANGFTNAVVTPIENGVSVMFSK